MKAFTRGMLALAVLASAGCATSRASLPSGAFLVGASAKAIGPGIDELFTNLQVGKTPGAAVVVLRGGRVVHQKGYGTADLATGRAIGPDTTFDLGQASMPVTAMAVMVLAEQGKVAYDAPASKWLPELGGAARAVTVRQLLNHTAGLPDYRPLYADKVAQGGWPANYAPTAKEILALVGAQPGLDFTPGEDFAASPSNYVALAQLVERASGQRFAAFVKQRVFKPLGMAHARVADEAAKPDPRRAVSYAFRGDAYRPFAPGPLDGVYGDGGVQVSARDLARWARAYGPGTLVGAEAIRQATTPPELTAGGRSNYGFGLLVKNSTTGDPMMMHAGQAAGFRAALLMRPEKGFMAVVLSNVKDTAALALADEIMNQVVR